MQLSIQFLAGPELRLDQLRVVPTVTRPLLVLSYLAFQEDWVSRDALLALFWPEVREAKARQSLRALLYSCKKEIYAHALEIEPTRVRWPVETDIHTFQEAVSNGDWHKAVRLYEGTFLERVQGDSSAVFEGWLEQTRDELHRAWRDAALRVANDLSGKAQAGKAANLLQKVLAYDFLDEDVVQACMRAQASAGRRAQALSTFESFSERLARELDMKPLGATLELAKAVRNDGSTFQNHSAPQKVASFVTTPTLPQPLTPFVGRTLELLELDNLLAQPHTRLITLLGPGGMGKSRLSLQLLEHQKAYFADGATFVSLAGLRSAADIPSATASALDLDLAGESSVADGVCAYLQAKTMLIVFDNFEHVLSGAVFVQQLFVSAPSCTFVCTSRILLGIANEVVYDLSGLSVPFSADKESDVEAYDAAQLFIRCARRIRSDFRVRERDHRDLFKLCKLLDGMPLALELAASWVRLFSLPDLVRALEQDLDLLEASGQQVSERHQSLRKVFEQSWQLLSAEEQRVLGALSVFYGSFERHAVSAVAQASARTLLALVNKSLLRSSASGRFSILFLLRQYAAEKLDEHTANYQEQHGIYYLSVLAHAREALTGLAPAAVLIKLEQDLENIRAAWHWACETERFDLCEQVLEPLHIFFTGKALLQEGIAFFERARGSLRTEHEPRFSALIHSELAYFWRRLDQHETAADHARAALALAQGLADSEALIVASLCELAIMNCWMGQFEESATYAERALVLAEKLQDPDLTVNCKSRLALAKRYQGHFAEAQRLYEEVLHYERRLGRQVDLLRILSDLGRLLVDLNKPHEAHPLFREGLELAERHDLPYELGFMWEGLSQCSYLLGDYPQARQQVETALRCSEAVHDTMGVAIQYADLAKTLLALNQLETAETYLKRALGIAWDKRELPEVMKHFVTWAKLLHKMQNPERAAALLSWAARHPAAQALSRHEALELLDTLDLTPVEQPNDTLTSTVAILLRTPF